MTDGKHQPRPEVTEEDVQRLRDAINAKGSNYFKSSQLEMPEYDASHISWICSNVSFVERWNDDAKRSTVSIWRVVDP